MVDLNRAVCHSAGDQLYDNVRRERFEQSLTSVQVFPLLHYYKTVKLGKHLYGMHAECL